MPQPRASIFGEDGLPEPQDRLFGEASFVAQMLAGCYFAQAGHPEFATPCSAGMRIGMFCIPASLGTVVEKGDVFIL